MATMVVTEGITKVTTRVEVEAMEETVMTTMAMVGGVASHLFFFFNGQWM